jgi:hypothetical protein
MEQLGSHWTDFHEFLYIKIFRKTVEKIQVPLKSDNNNVSFTWRPIYILNISRSFLLIMKHVSDKSYIKTRNTFYVQKPFIFFRKPRRIWEKRGKTLYSRAGHVRQYNTAKAHCIWIPKAINTLRICNMYCFSTATVIALTLLKVSYTYISRLVSTPQLLKIP